MAEQITSYDVRCPKEYGIVCFVGKDAHLCPISGNKSCVSCTAPRKSSAKGKELWVK